MTVINSTNFDNAASLHLNGESSVLQAPVSGLGQRVGNPLVDGFGIRRCRQRHHFMDFGCKANRQLAGFGLMRLNAFFGTNLKIDIYALFELFLNVFKMICLAVNGAANALCNGVKRLVLRFIPDFGDISLVALDQRIPAFCKNRLTAFTAPFLVSGFGWGRWNTSTSPFNTTAIRDPERSLMVAPSEMSRVSISRQRILAGIGSVKILSRVFSYFAFMAAPQNMANFERAVCAGPDTLFSGTNLVSKNDIVKAVRT